MNGSRVTAKIAGTESTAKMMSTASTMITHSSSGVPQSTILPVTG